MADPTNQARGARRDRHLRGQSWRRTFSRGGPSRGGTYRDHSGRGGSFRTWSHHGASPRAASSRRSSRTGFGSGWALESQPWRRGSWRDQTWRGTTRPTSSSQSDSFPPRDAPSTSPSPLEEVSSPFTQAPTTPSTTPQVPIIIFTCHHTKPPAPRLRDHAPIPTYVRDACHACLVGHARRAEQGLRFAYAQLLELRREARVARERLAPPDVEGYGEVIEETRGEIAALERQREERVQGLWMDFVGYAGEGGCIVGGLVGKKSLR